MSKITGEQMIYLAEPSLCHEYAYNEMIEEWERTAERLIPWVLRIDRSDFSRLVNTLLAMRDGASIVKGTVTGCTYWLMRDDGKMLGAANLRFSLNEKLAVSGGHVGYGIRPSERGKGYATELLRLSLRELKRQGIENAFITCDHDNYASERVIIKNGGELDSEIMLDGILTRRFWIRNIRAE